MMFGNVDYYCPSPNPVLDADWVFAGDQPQPVSTTLSRLGMPAIYNRQRFVK